jgi:hypothetical protein
MIEVEIWVKSSGAWIDRMASSLNSIIKVLECIPLQDGRGRFLLEIFPREPRSPSFQDHLEALLKEFDMDVVPYKKEMLMAAVEVPDSIITASLTKTNSYLTYVRAFPDHTVELHLIIKDEANLRALLDLLEESGWPAQLHSKTHVTARNLLTTREEDVIKLALDDGYYDYPKRINLRELADKLDISFSTLNEILHRGERKILREYYSMEE